MAMIATSKVLIEWLERAGIQVKGREVTRIIIDAKVGVIVKVYVNQNASEELFNVMPPKMDGAEVIGLNRAE